MKTRDVIEYIVDWLTDYVEDAGMKGFVIGVSGGIDSAVVSTLCAKTGKPTTLLMMPIQGHIDQIERSNNHVLRLAAKYNNISSRVIDLASTFVTFYDIFRPDELDDLALANTRSRLRMVSLYAIATTYKLLVVGTGNKVEDFGVGFYTKYGDGGVDISPIADLMKSEVYEVAKELGISQEIIDATPTDGLWDDSRGDEDQIGATYDELEWAMNWICSNQPNREISQRQREVLNIFDRFHRKNKHKMEPIPICMIPERLK